MTPRPKWMSLPVMPREPTIGKQTAAEMLAYCRAWYIPVVGPILAQQEYRVGPHPRSYCPKLHSKPLPTYHLADQLPVFFTDLVEELCAEPWDEYSYRSPLGQPFDHDAFCEYDEPDVTMRTANV
jgi:hypothetical protein